MKILVSNDDGYNAPGIIALVDKLLSLNITTEINVLAPDRDKSGASNSLTLDRPLMPIEFNYHLLSANHKLKQTLYLNGTPTDCVHVAITALLENKQDIVISGINAGANLGDDVIYSGTVAAATEGRHLGLPALAVSLANANGTTTLDLNKAVAGNSNDKLTNNFFDTAAKVIAHVLACLGTIPSSSINKPQQGVLNINVPNLPYDDLKGIKITRLGKRHKAEAAVKEKDPRGRTIYWLGPVGPLADAGEGTDFDAIANGYVSITPLSIDLTHYEQIKQLQTWPLNSF